MLNNKSEPSSYSLRKIPVKEYVQIQTQENNDTDKIKILELNNAIDLWEKEILFSENGFYSLKGKETENKIQEFTQELEEFVNGKILEIKFQTLEAKEEAISIKNSKIASIKAQMKNYETLRLNEWENEVFETAIQSSVNRAVLYKNNPDIIINSYKNGMIVLSLMSQKEKWDSKTCLASKKKFENDFYFSLINEMVKDKEIQAFVYFEKYKDKLTEENKEKLEASTKSLKNNITAYNWAKELWSYNLKDDENEKEIKHVKDKEIQTLIRKYISDFKKDKKKKEDEEKKDKNIKNWEEIISVLQTEPDKAELYIDYGLEKENQNLKKSYIQEIRKNGFIKTDEEEFLKLLKEIYEDNEKFKNKDISDYHHNLSDSDYKIIEKLKENTDDNYYIFLSDYDYIQKELTKEKITKAKDIYRIIKYMLSAKKLYEKKNNKEADVEVRDKIIKSALERYKNK